MNNYYEPTEEKYLHSENSNKEALVASGQVVLAHIKYFDEQKLPVVSYMVAGKTFTATALFTTPIDSASINRQVALTFLENNIHKPLILGVVYSPLYDYLTKITEATEESSEGDRHSLEVRPVQNSASDSEAKLEGELQTLQNSQGLQKARAILQEPVVVDGKKVKIEGADQVELRCGEASITLTNNGKILIRGKYVLNRASGVNRIVGGSVQVN